MATFGEGGGLLDKYSYSSENCCDYFLGHVLEKMGFLFKHLVTQLVTSKPNLSISFSMTLNIVVVVGTKKYAKIGLVLW